MSRIWGTEMVSQHVVIERTCDGCGKTGRGEPDGWHAFDSYHSDWGNDSIESTDQLDACSGACYLRILRKVVADYGEQEHPTLKVDGKTYAFARDIVYSVGMMDPQWMRESGNR